MHRLDLPHYRHDVQGLPANDTCKPLLVFLHGSGERGSDLGIVRRHGPPGIFPRLGWHRFIVISPQCPASAVWNAAFLAELVAAAIDAYPVDASRVCLTGISMGGVGAWELGTGSPGIFSALAPICGGGDATRADSLVTVVEAKPVWLFHSAADRIMPIAGTDAIFDALRVRNADVTYTRYDRLDHVQTWERAYGSSVLCDWLFAQRRA